MASLTGRGIRSWAHLRFLVIGGLLANPPEKGQLQQELQKLAQNLYSHPIKKNQKVRFGVSTIERWYYQARNSPDPIKALGRKRRTDAGVNRCMSSALIAELKKQYRRYPRWSYQLHSDNLNALILENPHLGESPSYSTVLRRMQKFGWIKQKRILPKTKGGFKAQKRLHSKEVRGFESPYVHALWHLDFHSGKRVIDHKGKWHTPKALCILDDHSRLCCHLQWYLDETADSLIHGFIQALHKRGVPRSLMSDNGSAMISGEFQNGLFELGIKHDKTLPYSPYQNGKQEAFWGQLEGRLLAMLTHVEPLTLEFLNKATQAWVEQEYNRSKHEETGLAPLERMLQGADVSRPSRSGDVLRFFFTLKEKRIQRLSDGTIQVKGVRFEIPSRFRHIRQLLVAYLPSDLSTAYLVDEQTGENIGQIYPQDKTKNADGGRRTLEPSVLSGEDENVIGPGKDGIPPLLRKLLSDYAATGLPPAYIPGKEQPTQSTEFDDTFLF